jgi:flagellin-like hook-associated protein FlgL
MLASASFLIQSRRVFAGLVSIPPIPMITSIVSNSSYSAASYVLSNNSKATTEAVGRIASASQSTAGQNPLQSDSLSLRLKNSASMNSNVISNVGNALSYLDAQASSLQTIASLVTRMGDITSKLNDVTQSAADRSNYSTELNSLRDQVGTELDATYGSQSLHDRYGQGPAYNVGLNSDGTQSIAFAPSDLLSSAGGAWDTLSGTVVESVPTFDENGNPIDTTSSTPSFEKWTVSDYESLQNGVAGLLATNSAQQSTLRGAIDLLKARDSASTSAVGQISDSDMAHEVAFLAKSQLINQSASSAMTQTNVSAQGVVKALWGEPSSGIEWYKPDTLTSILPKIAFA